MMEDFLIISPPPRTTTESVDDPGMNKIRTDNKINYLFPARVENFTWEL